MTLLDRLSELPGKSAVQQEIEEGVIQVACYKSKRVQASAHPDCLPFPISAASRCTPVRKT
jgi:hypothetical protein